MGLGAAESSHGVLRCLHWLIHSQLSVQRRFFSAHKAFEIVFVLIGDMVPGVLRENAARGFSPIVCSFFREFFDSAQMFGQIRGIVAEKDSAICNDFAIEWIVQSQHAITVSRELSAARG